MGQSIVQKIIGSHLLTGEMVPGREIAIKIDQTLTQDATGTLACLQFEAMGVPRVKTRLSVSYVDHNTLQTGFENADDHRFLQTIAARYGIYFSRPGNGICHQVHLERFAVPGMTLLGSDSHTPMAGGLGMIALGAGGLDVAVAMAGGPFYLTMPRVVDVRLTGRLNPWVSAKDIILELLRLLTVKGGVGKIMEYAGEGVKTLGVPERATIANMGAELGTTTSVFPSDDLTLTFLKAQKREKDWQLLAADPDANYDEAIDLNLAGLEPLVALPHSPDKVVKVREAGPVSMQQVVIGSCTNSSYQDLMRVAAVLKGRKVHPSVSLSIAPGSRQVLEMLARNGALADLISAGARILETACGPCIGMGQAPPSGTATLRTFNRNFAGRSGTADAGIYLAGPEVAAATALAGVLSDPRKLGEHIEVKIPGEYLVDDSMVLPPAADPAAVEIQRGPNIKPLPVNQKPPAALTGPVLLKLGDDITTDQILPAGAKILPLRSNIPAISRYVFAGLDPSFADRAQKSGGGFLIGGRNYGQGSSREHAALAPMYLGIKAVIAKSFARIHRANLINFGILPLTFVHEEDYDRVAGEDNLIITMANLGSETELSVQNTTKTAGFKVRHGLTPRQLEIIKAGGLLNYTRQQNA